MIPALRKQYISDAAPLPPNETCGVIRAGGRASDLAGLKGNAHGLTNNEFSRQSILPYN